MNEKSIDVIQDIFPLISVKYLAPYFPVHWRHNVDFTHYLLVIQDIWNWVARWIFGSSKRSIEPASIIRCLLYSSFYLNIVIILLNKKSPKMSLHGWSLESLVIVGMDYVLL